jgi:putative transposase
MHAYLSGIFNQRESPALLVGGVSDHVHILCNLSRRTGISNLVGEAKRASSLWVKEKGVLLRKFNWQSGYGAFSIGQSQIAYVKQYIATQEEHHQKVSFQDKFRGTLTEKLLTFALGRGVEYYDAPAVRKIVHEAQAKDFRFSTIILGIVNSAPFTMRRVL